MFQLFAAFLVALGLASVAVAQNLETAAVTCATTATLAYTAGPRGGTVLIQNVGVEPIYVGGAAVTTATGVRIIADAAISFAVLGNGRAYCIVGAATEPARVMRGVRLQ